MMDCYVVLGLGREASLGEIKRAYRRLARRYHPNLNPGDREAAVRFQRIVEAYEILSDPSRRRRYDAGALEADPAPQPSVGFEGFDFSVSVTGAEAPTFGDLFSDIWQSRVSPPDARRAMRGADLHHGLAVPFELAVRGGQWPVTVTRQEACADCRGAGVASTAERVCATCRGARVLKATRGHMVFSRSCVPCRGTGRQSVAVRCPACGGQQRAMRTETLTLDLPPGIADGAEIRVAGKGHAGLNGGPSGDLCITARVEPHPIFRRQGLDLHMTVPVAVHEAGLGAKIEIPTLDGPARLRVPPGTQSGQRFRLRERGVPAPAGHRRGDLVVEVRVVLPPTLDERSKTLLREFGRLNPGDVRKDRAPDWPLEPRS
jgi:molecular chaperone DnaJ